ncbi:MAG TPA: M20/M25/M40 family metallo-hydrolase [Gemmatimonadaceae bacterium]|nr:M20/M25/M40 family metallo-hydrolase [Gemmatimonadaceae bacterium]
MGSKIIPRAMHAGLVVLLAACSSGQASEQHSDIVQRYTSLGSPAGADMGMQVDTAVAGVLRSIDPAEIRATDSTLVAFGTRHTLSDTLSDTRGNGAARRYLHAKLEGYSKDCGGCLKVEYDAAMIEIRRFPSRPMANVVNVLAWLPGRDAKRVVVITGHYDSCICQTDHEDAVSDAPGADDDASGTSAVVELARVFSRRFPKGLQATVLFALVGAEEQGLLGSTHLAQRLHDEGYTVIGDMSDDIVGNIRSDDGLVDSTTMRIYSADPDNSPSRELARYAVALGGMYNPAFRILHVQRIDRIGRGTDHEPFVALGYPGIRTTERMEALSRQHSPRDVFEQVNFGYAANIARLNSAVIGSLGLAPPAPDSVRARRHPPSGQSWDLSWARVPGATSYEVLVRSTTSPVWERVIQLGDTTSYELAAQLDDLWAAVRSVGADGHRSLAVVVPPARGPRGMAERGGERQSRQGATPRR